MKFKSVEYKPILTINNTFKILKITYYFGICWVSEFIGEEYYDLSSAKTFIKNESKKI